MRKSKKASNNVLVRDNKESIHSEITEKASVLSLSGSDKKRTASAICLVM